MRGTPVRKLPGKPVEGALRPAIAAPSCGGREAVGGSDALKKPALPGVFPGDQLRYEMLIRTRFSGEEPNVF